MDSSIAAIGGYVLSTTLNGVSSLADRDFLSTCYDPTQIAGIISAYQASDSYAALCTENVNAFCTQFEFVIGLTTAWCTDRPGVTKTMIAIASGTPLLSSASLTEPIDSVEATASAKSTHRLEKVASQSTSAVNANDGLDLTSATSTGSSATNSTKVSFSASSASPSAASATSTGAAAPASLLPSRIDRQLLVVSSRLHLHC